MAVIRIFYSQIVTQSLYSILSSSDSISRLLRLFYIFDSYYPCLLQLLCSKTVTRYNYTPPDSVTNYKSHNDLEVRNEHKVDKKLIMQILYF